MANGKDNHKDIVPYIPKAVAARRSVKLTTLMQHVARPTKRKNMISLQGVRNYAKAGWNAWADCYFYNVEQEDIDLVADVEGCEGSVFFIPAPESSDKPEWFWNAHQFLVNKCSERVGAIAVPGVGSTALGAVALARDVAQGTNLPVAAVVSGHGIMDSMFEGWGGADWLTWDNRIDFWLSELKQMGFSFTWPGLTSWLETRDDIAAGADVLTVKTLLRKQKHIDTPSLPHLKWIVGHSKGNLVIASALDDLVTDRDLMRKADVRVVLFGAVVTVPEIRGWRVRQYIGQLDVLGEMNSRHSVQHTTVPFASHHLNRHKDFYMDAVGLLADS
jgi:hypothetical protein